MAKLDPVQGLVDYILEVKPYHTKIIEVLVEYIQTDSINVNIAENFDMCVELGIPDIDSRYSYPIIGVDTIANTFTITGDQQLSLHIGQVMEIFRSTGNDNRYTIGSLVFDGTNTKVGVTKNIPSNSVSGVIVYRIIEFCLDSNLYGELIKPETEELCSGGFGDIFDSIPTTYDVQSINSPAGTITVVGNQSSIFTTGMQFFFEYVTDITSSVISAAYTISSVAVDNTDSLNPLTIITTVQPIPSLSSGSPVATLSTGVVYPLDSYHNIDGINESGTINTFTINGDFTGSIISGSIIDVRFSNGNDGIYYAVRSDLVGGSPVQTRIHVSQHVPFPNATNRGRLNIKDIGFDEVVHCSTIPEARIDITFDERIEFSNTLLELSENIIAYNLENTDNTPFGGLPYGTVIDANEPVITISATAPSPTGSPLSIPLFSLWYDTSDTNNAYLNQWNGLRWVGIDAAYWFDSNVDILYQRIYKKVGGSPAIDTGWLEVTTIGGWGGTGFSGIGQIEPIAIQNFNAVSIGSPAVGQKVYTLATSVPGSDPSLLSVTVNGVPAAFTLNTATTFTIEYLEGSPPGDTQDIINPGDWVIATIKNNTATQSNVLIAGFANEPHIVFHSPGSVTATDYFEIYGGNFAYHFFGGTIFEGFDDTQKLGDWKITTFPVTAVSAGSSPGKYSMSIVGDHTAYFVTGRRFYVDYTVSNKGWFTVAMTGGSGSPSLPVVYDSTTNITTIYTMEEVTNVTFTNDFYEFTGSPAGSPMILQSQTQIVQDYSKNLGVIQGALFDEVTQKTIVIPQTITNTSVDRIVYEWIGPLHIDVDFLPIEMLSPTVSDTFSELSPSIITEDLTFGWTVDNWFQYPILSIDLIENTITVDGDARVDLQIGQDFIILGAFDTTGSPPGSSPAGITNNGSYSVRIDEDYRTFASPPQSRSEVEYNGSNTIITVYPDLITSIGPYGVIEPNNDADAIITLNDIVGVTLIEGVDGTVIQTGGSIVDSWDYPYFDVGGFDETLGTVIHLYSNTFE